ncbi:precorrin-6A synthase (deacetylating) [Luteipulveratus sp. YIM 133132]|uniref:Precorrin-6A synthase (Deacetylating) n=1 Tax=Luteipulveratus flavus TaxID=3031728 RepID=A0ABT6C688_9MICO|nr:MULTISPECIES: precorrin-6A synthase (deacetylating) [unclassified Luteipulveratus]MDE9365224.1 precorrin-6A synthase (deacetylating) [Luteipulveratus sp. YIM 133132]MDF8264439.1 precorrin-6A synthase (deacetylating) [Luteipulveratus sp. YIM 133296]
MTPPVRVSVIGIGCGSPDHLTLQAVRALGSLDVVVLTDKRRGDDPLVHVRERMLAEHVAGVQTVVVHDPPRERRAEHVGDQRSYERAVEDWHDARASAYADALAPYRGRQVGFLVWGDPAFYDSTLRILGRVAAAGLPLDIEVVPGVSAVQLLAARHRLVLNDIGAPITVTTGRRLAEEADRGTDNIVVMLNRSLDAVELGDDWHIWWGANLGTAHESLLSGDLRTTAPQIDGERNRVRAAAGWVMDVYLLRRRA